MNLIPENCKKCEKSLTGESILDTFIKQREEGVRCWEGMSDLQIEEKMKECYSEPYYFSNVIGIEDRHGQFGEVYDGISWWRCIGCGYTWSRFDETKEFPVELKEGSEGKIQE